MTRTDDIIRTGILATVLEIIVGVLSYDGKPITLLTLGILFIGVFLGLNILFALWEISDKLISDKLDRRRRK